LCYGTVPEQVAHETIVGETIYQRDRIVPILRVLEEPPITASDVKYSLFNLIRQTMNGHRGWKPAWRDPQPRSRYDAIIIGGGGHGLATAYYLAREHGITNVAVLEKGYIGSGNAGRNTTIVRSNYLLDGNQPFYEHSLKLWEGLEQDLNYNVMMSQRGVINLYHTDAQRDAYVRRGNAMLKHGADSVLLNRDELRARVPLLDFDNARFPILGALMQPRGGTARHDAVVWGYARGADSRGVDIIQNCEVTGIRVVDGAVTGVDTSRGYIAAGKVGMAVAGNSSRVAAMAGMRLPVESHVLQAFVTEGLKPLVDQVVTFGAGHFYISQSDKGGLVLGGDLDGYNSYAQRGNLPMVEHVIECGVAMMPTLGRLRILRHWGGVMDMSMDGSPIIDKTPIRGLYLNTGWCYGGFKATPASGWCFAHTMARDEAHRLNSAYRLDRFLSGHLIDEKGGGPRPNVH
jgi:methylglutamate dehydrogenase subunit A